MKRFFSPLFLVGALTSTMAMEDGKNLLENKLPVNEKIEQNTPPQINSEKSFTLLDLEKIPSLTLEERKKYKEDLWDYLEKLGKEKNLLDLKIKKKQEKLSGALFSVTKRACTKEHQEEVLEFLKSKEWPEEYINEVRLESFPPVSNIKHVFFADFFKIFKQENDKICENLKKLCLEKNEIEFLGGNTRSQYLILGTMQKSPNINIIKGEEGNEFVMFSFN